MSVAWTQEEIANEVRRQTTLEGVAHVMGLVLTRHNLMGDADAIASIEDNLKRFRTGEEMSPMELYDLAIAARMLPTDASYELFSRDKDSREIFSELIRKADTVDVCKTFQEIGDKFSKEMLKDIDEEGIRSVPYMVEKIKTDEIKIKNKVYCDKYFEFSDLRCKIAQDDEEYISIINNNDLPFNERDRKAFKRLTEISSITYNRILENMPEYDEIKKLRSKVEAIQEKIFSNVMQALNSASPISEDEAQKWANNNVSFDDNALRRLKKIGYKREEILKDIAQVYRLIGGKLGAVVFQYQARGGNRAFAKGKNVISVQGEFNKQTLFHEIGHLAEHFDKGIQRACYQFITGRATGKKMPMRDITGMKGYKRTEYAFPDSFFHPYVGKDYGEGSSEVLSMAIQCFSSPKALTNLLAIDKEHFNILLGACLRQHESVKKSIAQNEIEIGKNRDDFENEKKRIKAWEKQLDAVATDELFERLNTFGGYRGFAIGETYKSGFFNIYDTNSKGLSGESKIRRAAAQGYGNGLRKKAALRFAYLLIANSDDLLHEYHYFMESFTYADLANMVSTPPELFKIGMTLPRVI